VRSATTNLTGNVSGFCPECGTPVTVRQTRPPAAWIDYSLLAICAVILGAFVIAAIARPSDNICHMNHTRAALYGLDASLALYRLHVGAYPARLRHLVEPPAENTGSWRGPYLEAIPQDTWGNDLIYVCPGRFNAESYDLSSAGPNGVTGDDDDIAAWRE
jgi:type II secretion system protein G